MRLRIVGVVDGDLIVEVVGEDVFGIGEARRPEGTVVEDELREAKQILNRLIYKTWQKPKKGKKQKNFMGSLDWKPKIPI